ncbi:MAG: BLUF domain-containing protein [Magnetovibrionaceae bacterium]
MIRLIYVSKQSDGLSDSDIESILDVARANNSGVDVTGVLIVTETMFIQALEGASSAVMDLYAQIEKDPRHHSAEIVLREPIEERAFSDWSMGFVRRTDAEVEADLGSEGVVGSEGLFDHLLAEKSLTGRMLTRLARKN